MKYLAITQKTAEWLINEVSTCNSLKNWLENTFNFNAELSAGVVFYKSLRITSLEDTVLCIWNQDYILATGDEKWGFIRLDGDLGLLGKRERFKKTFEDFLYVINQRLQGLLITHSSKKHNIIGEHLHSLSNSSQTDTYAILFKDVSFYDKNIKVQSVICTGTAPDIHIEKQKAIINETEGLLPNLLSYSNKSFLVSKNRPALELLNLQRLVQNQFSNENNSEIMDMPKLEDAQIDINSKYETYMLSYDKWINEKSSLNPSQREILNSDALSARPIRIIGAAGTGKTLLMQLLTIKRLRQAKDKNQPLKILYVCHSSDMVNNVKERFEILGAGGFFNNNSEDNSSLKQHLEVKTLFQYCYENTDGIADEMIMSPDVYQNKEFQKSLINDFLNEVLNDYKKRNNFNEDNYPIIYQILNDDIKDVFLDVLINEIGVAIKGKIEDYNKQKYVESEISLSRLHKALNTKERNFIYDIFQKYHNYFMQNSLLDSDDIAISFLQSKKTPVWNLRRKKDGFDFVFVDETQLFNENERQLFSFLTKNNSSYVPIVLALDEAQDLKGGIHKGFGVLGIEQLENKHLIKVHRCTEEILRLAFYVIQRTTDLFGSEFPDFTKTTVTIVSSSHRNTYPPRLIKASSDLCSKLVETICELRNKNIRQICVVVHSNIYWSQVLNCLSDNLKDELKILDRRGEQIMSKNPMVVLTRPESVGGQEFDVVICIGLEDGVVPKKVSYAPLNETFNQQSLREMYIAFTRAKHQLIVINSPNSSPTEVLNNAITEGYLIESN